jgi:hypothetical protein
MYVVLDYQISRPAVNDKTRCGSEGSDEWRELDSRATYGATGNRFCETRSRVSSPTDA